MRTLQVRANVAEAKAGRETWLLSRGAEFSKPADRPINSIGRKAFGVFGLKVSRIDAEIDQLNLVEASPADRRIMQTVRPYTMTSPARVWAILNAIQYLSASHIEGDICECGVWRGGSTMAAALKLTSIGDFRRIWLYDTFAGMPEPTELDKATANAAPAHEVWRNHQRGTTLNAWCFASLNDVQRNFESTGYPDRLVNFVIGKVEETLKSTSNVPGKIALLRLDTDWYESTKAELETLYERVVPGGVLIVDDYGYWEGARRAVDEFFASRAHKILLNRIDSTGRIGVKIK